MNIDKIRKNAISEIKEKVKKYPGPSGYLNPCNKERLEDMKRLMFISGNEFTSWMQKNGIMKSVTEINREELKKALENAGCKTRKEYKDKCAQKAGFKNHAKLRREYVREWRYKTGKCLPKEFNEDCSAWFGEFTENLMIHRYPGAKKMPYGNRGFDYLWNGVKIDNKGGCLQYVEYRSPYAEFRIGFNNVADVFTLSGWDNRESLTPLFALEFKKDDLVRYGNGGDFAPKVEFWKRESIGITYTPEGLKQFEDYQTDIDWLKELCGKDEDTKRNKDE